MQTIFVRTTRVADVSLQDEVWAFDFQGNRRWLTVEQMAVNTDETYTLWFEGVEEPVYFVEDDTLHVKEEVE